MNKVLRMTIHDEYIYEGSQNDQKSCPIALAFKERYGNGIDVFVTGERVLVDGVEYTPEDDLMSMFISIFDSSDQDEDGNIMVDPEDEWIFGAEIGFILTEVSE